MRFGLEENVLNRIRAVFQNHEAVQEALIYGSRAKETHRPASDIDICVKGSVSDREMSRLETELDDLLLPYKIDLCAWDQIETQSLKDDIAAFGRVFHARSDETTTD